MNKIVVASPLADFSGGAVRSMYQLLLNLKKRGYDPIVILPAKGSIGDQLKKDNIRTEIVPFDWWIHGQEGSDDFESGTVLNSKAIIKLSEIITKEQPRVCLTYTIDMPWLAYAAYLCNVPHICQICEDINDEKWKTRLPVKDTVKIIDELSDKLFANSEFIKKRLQKHVSKNQDIGVVYPYIDQKAVIRQSKKVSLQHNNAFTMTLVGAIMPAKGQYDAVRAAHKLIKAGKDVNLQLVGGIADQSYFNKIKEYVQKNNIRDKIFFVGEVDNPHIFTSNSDLALVCSKNEPFGRITIEAMCLGVPIIGADSGGTKEIIGGSGDYGLLYETQNYNDLAKKIEYIVENPQEAKSMADRARTYVSKLTLEKCQEPIFTYLELGVQARDGAAELYAGDLIKVFSGAIESLQKELNFHRRIAEERSIETKAVLSELHAVRSSNSYKVGRILLSPLRITKPTTKKAQIK